jgi:uncharacterized protein YdhG (YjbR/CyaY superfamily)
MISKPATIDEYLSNVPPAMRAALEDLRAIIRATAPDADECISYQMPAFRQGGLLVGFAAHAHHCALYGSNITVVAALADQLEGFKISKGTIRFTPERPIPEAVVRMLVKEKLAAKVKLAAMPKARS